MSKNKTVKANNYSAALKSIEAIEGLKTSVLPKEINENEKHLFHVLVVDSRPNRATLKFDHKVSVKKFQREAFAIGTDKKKYAQLGYGQFIVIHNPNKKEEDELPAAETIELIDAATTLEELYGILNEGESRKTVLAAFDKKAAELVTEE